MSEKADLFSSIENAVCCGSPERDRRTNKGRSKEILVSNFGYYKKRGFPTILKKIFLFHCSPHFFSINLKNKTKNLRLKNKKKYWYCWKIVHCVMFFALSLCEEEFFF